MGQIYQSHGGAKEGGGRSTVCVHIQKYLITYRRCCTVGLREREGSRLLDWNRETTTARVLAGLRLESLDSIAVSVFVSVEFDKY